MRYCASVLAKYFFFELLAFIGSCWEIEKPTGYP